MKSVRATAQVSDREQRGGHTVVTCGMPNSSLTAPAAPLSPALTGGAFCARDGQPKSLILHEAAKPLQSRMRSSTGSLALIQKVFGIMIDEPEYSAAAKGFHWLTALLLVVQFLLGWIMPNIGRGMQPESLINLHLSIGTLILVAALARVTWRLFHGVPAPEASLPAWQARMAGVLHAGLYVLLFAMVVTGWTYASMRGWTVTVFGLLSLPALVAQGSGIGRAIGELHGVLGWVLLGAIGLHVAAALAHLLFWRDRVMQRMLPRLGSGG
jgi:cytochrome b561